MKILTGSFEKGCGVIVYDTTNDAVYHRIVFRDVNGYYIEMGDKRYYKKDLEIKEA